MERKFLFIILLFFLTGCTQAKQLAHLDQLMTLQGLSENRDEQANFVDDHNKKFAQLREAVKNDQLKEYPNKKVILQAFGEPIIAKTVMDQGEPREEWLYRYATKYFNSDKIYLYFDSQGNLIRCDHVVPPPAKVASQISPTPSL